MSLVPLDEPDQALDKMVNEGSPELYMFSSDYPHAEGGRDPIGRFERSTESQRQHARGPFFAMLYGAV